MRVRFVIWLLAVCALVAVFALRVLPALNVQTDLQQLLPQGADRSVQERSRQSAEVLSQRFVYLLKGTDALVTQAAADALVVRLRASAEVASVNHRVNPQALSQVLAAYAPYSGYLLDPATRQALASGQPESLIAQAEADLYAPGGRQKRTGFAVDPLGLHDRFLASAQPQLGQVTLQNDGLVVIAEGAVYAVVMGQLRASPFNREVQSALLPYITEAEAAATATGVQVLRAGVVFHALAAAEQAQFEMRWFGAGSAAAAWLVMLCLFRSPTAVLLPQLAIVVGGMAAVSVCHWWFGSIHALTLVFGVSLIGLAVDYGGHYAADQLQNPATWQPVDALPHVAPSLMLSLAATVLAYGALAVAPMPALRQMALFTTVGLTTSAVTVLAIYPMLLRRAPSAHMQQLAQRMQEYSLFLRRHCTRQRLVLIAAPIGLCLGLAGATQLQFNDDLRLLSQSPAAVLDSEQQVRSVLGSLPDSRFYLLRARSAEALLIAEEQLRIALDAAVARKELGAYAAVSQGLPSLKAQKENYQILKNQVYAKGAALDQLGQRLGFSATQFDAARTAFAAQTQPLQPEEWLGSAASQSAAALWLGKRNGEFASQMVLYGVEKPLALAALAEDAAGVVWVDRVAEVTAQLTQFRRSALFWLAMALLAYTGVLTLRYGIRSALLVAVAPAASATLTLAVLALCGVEANFFHVLGLLLVLGLGLDYAVFLRESHCAPSTLLAVSLSALTTLIGFGLLAFSQTPFIASLGGTLALGITLTYICALMVGASHFASRI